MISLLDILFPKFCLGCGKWGSYICAECTRKLKPLSYLKCPVCQQPAVDGLTHPRCQTRHGIDGIMSFFRYDGVVKKAIKDIKYRYISDITSGLISHAHPSSYYILKSYFLNPACRQAGHNSCYFIPIPLHPSRFRHRGFNQAETLARVLGKQFGISVRSDILFRKKKTEPQVVVQSRKHRFANVKGIFSINNNITIDNATVILTDDVYTSGATLRSAASVLKHAGARQVFGVTIAQ